MRDLARDLLSLGDCIVVIGAAVAGIREELPRGPAGWIIYTGFAIGAAAFVTRIAASLA